MQIKVLTETPERTIAAVFDPAEEAAAGLLQIAVEQNLTAARLTGIGALSRGARLFRSRKTRLSPHRNS